MNNEAELCSRDTGGSCNTATQQTAHSDNFHVHCTRQLEILSQWIFLLQRSLLIESYNTVTS